MLNVDTLEFPLDRASLQTLTGICMGPKILKEAYLLNIGSSRAFVDKWRARLSACQHLDDLHALVDACIQERSELINWQEAYPQTFSAWVQLAAEREQELEVLSQALRAEGGRTWYYDRERAEFTYARYWNPIPHVDHLHQNRFYGFLTPQNVASVGAM
jgi:hypothetical protein